MRKAYKAEMTHKSNRSDKYHFPDAFYDATAACHARTGIDYTTGQDAELVPSDQRCGRPGCAKTWKHVERKAG